MAMDLQAVIESALTFLLTRRDARGWWRDFDTLAGQSSEWVTAYVGSILANLHEKRAAEAARRSWRLLRRSRWWSAGWGYNQLVPADADSTIWALHLAESTGAADSFRARRAREFLAGHLNSRGGVATYAAAGPIRHFTRLERNISFCGWCQAHPSVTAAAGMLRTFTHRGRVCDHLSSIQNEDGSWPSYWWCDREYPTALAALALAARGQRGDQSRVRRAVKWASSRIGPEGAIGTGTHPEGSVFATSLGLRILFLAPSPGVVPVCEAALDWLLRQPLSSGTNFSSAALRIPPPDLTNPDHYESWDLHGKGGGSILFDQHRIFTTATLLAAFCDARAYRKFNP